MIDIRNKNHNTNALMQPREKNKQQHYILPGKRDAAKSVSLVSPGVDFAAKYQNLRGPLVSQICREILQFAARLWGISPQWSLGALSGWVLFYDTNNLRHTYLLNICHSLVLVSKWRDALMTRLQGWTSPMILKSWSISMNKPILIFLDSRNLLSPVTLSWEKIDLFTFLTVFIVPPWALLLSLTVVALQSSPSHQHLSWPEKFSNGQRELYCIILLWGSSRT